jgi:hypothetical protein
MVILTIKKLLGELGVSKSCWIAKWMDDFSNPMEISG